MFVAEYEEFDALKRSLNLGPDSHVLLINSEGNTDPDEFRRVVWEGANSIPAAYRWKEAGSRPSSCRGSG
jgi:diaminopropionate ammonia-lyase